MARQRERQKDKQTNNSWSNWQKNNFARAAHFLVSLWYISLPLSTSDICLRSFTEKFGTPREVFWLTESQ